MTQLLQTVGIILQAIPFQDYHQILSIYSKDFGLIKLISKFSLSKKRQGKGSFSPLTCWEFVFTKGNGDFFKYESAEHLESFLHLREHIDSLEAACLIAKTLLKSQPPEIPAPKLYSLLFTYLSKLHLAKNPLILSSSFMLKTLSHEGLIHLNAKCSTCNETVKMLHVYCGESFCETHSPSLGIENLLFSEEETALLFILTHETSFKNICSWVAEQSFHQKVTSLFETTIFLLK